MSEIYKALATAQAQMASVTKGATNPYFEARYAELSSVLEVVLPALNAAGICLYQPIGTDEVGRYVDTVLAHSSGEQARDADAPNFGQIRHAVARVGDHLCAALFDPGHDRRCARRGR